MNCKPGDLAVVARATAENILPHLGKVVTCIRLSQVHEDSWETEPELEPGRFVYDGALRPIRPQSDDATDEMVQLLGKPSEVTA